MKWVKRIILFVIVAGICIGARILISGGDPDAPTGMGAHPK
ncbi:MAG TPA: hypothetical protein VGC41_27425 [Kofleriaceae bacterium]